MDHVDEIRLQRRVLTEERKKERKKVRSNLCLPLTLTVHFVAGEKLITGLQQVYISLTSSFQDNGWERMRGFRSIVSGFQTRTIKGKSLKSLKEGKDKRGVI
jgi:hypothetical protein